MLHAIQPRFPELPVVYEPPFGAAQRGGVEGKVVLAPAACASNQARAFKHFYVLGDGVEGNRKRRGDLTHRRGGPPQSRQNGSSRGVAQRREDVVEGSSTLNHMVEYIAAAPGHKDAMRSQAPG